MKLQNIYHNDRVVRNRVAAKPQSQVALSLELTKASIKANRLHGVKPGTYRLNKSGHALIYDRENTYTIEELCGAV